MFSMAILNLGYTLSLLQLQIFYAAETKFCSAKRSSVMNGAKFSNQLP
jgi:hypothetical protein